MIIDPITNLTEIAALTYIHHMMLHDSLPTLGWLDIHIQWNVSLTLEWNLKPIFANVWLNMELLLD